MTVTDRGTGSNGVAGTTVVIAPGSNMAVGSAGIICLAQDNATANATNLTTTSYTDSVGNIWLVKTTGFGTTANFTQEANCFVCSPLVTAFTTSDSLTVNLNASTTAKAWTLIEAAPGTDNVVMWVDGSIGATSNTTSPTISTLEIPIGALVVGCGAAETPDIWTGDADTSNGSWSTKQSTGVGSGTSAMSVISQTKVTTTSMAAQTYNPTLSGAQDVRVGWNVFVECNNKGRLISPWSSNSTASMTWTIENGLAVGSIGVLCIAADNAAGTGGTKNFPSTFNDSKSNVWTLRLNELYDPGAAAAGIEMAIYTGALTSALVTDDTLTVTFSVANVVSKGGAIWEFAPVAAGTMSFVSSGFQAGSGTNAPSVTTTSITSGDYVVGLSCTEQCDAYTGDSDTTNGSWKTMMHYGKVLALSGTCLCTQWKKTTATATQTFNPTLATSLDTIIGWISINESAAAAGSTGNFFMAF